MREKIRAEDENAFRDEIYRLIGDVEGAIKNGLLTAREYIHPTYNDYGEICNTETLLLYYYNDYHIGTWSDIKGKGWVTTESLATVKTKAIEQRTESERIWAQAEEMCPHTD